MIRRSRRAGVRCGDLTGRLEGGAATTTTTYPGGPGPSYLDVPEPGCWHFELTWGTLQDSIDLLYVAP